MSDKPRELFIGRFQPFHNGHKWLIDQQLEKGNAVLIAVRDIEPDERNPLTTMQTVEILLTAYRDKDVKVIVIPDISGVNYGRGVGYEINEHVPPDNIGAISATEVRKRIKEGDESWRHFIDTKVQHLVEKYLK